MSRRTQRVGENLREILSDLISTSVKDPRIGFVTITAVRVTTDLRMAYVYYTVYGDSPETQAGLESARPFLRTQAGRRMRLKTLPNLEFHPDDSSSTGGRIDQLLAEIHRQQESRDEDESPPIA